MNNEIKERAITKLMEISGGNPGCLMFIAAATADAKNERDILRLTAGLTRMEALQVVGDKLYMLWNDCCGRDVRKTIDVMMDNSTVNIIEHINYSKGRGIPYEI